MKDIRIPKYILKLWYKPIKFFRYTSRKSPKPYYKCQVNREELIFELMTEYYVLKELLIFILNNISKIQAINYYDDEAQIELLLIGKNRTVDRVSITTPLFTFVNIIEKIRIRKS